MSQHSELRSWLTARSDRLVGELAEACSISSVSAELPEESARMAGWLRDRLAGLFETVELVDADGAPPAVIARSAPSGAPTLLLYSHYDVQPAGEGWSEDAFTPSLRDGRLYARGVADDKADILARIHALEAIRELGLELGIDLVWLSEGAEEIGSPGLAEVVDARAQELRSDACLWESYLRSETGRPEIGFGSRGLVSLELSLELLRSDQHSAFAGVVRSAPIELSHAIASMVDPDGRVLVRGLRAEADPETGEIAARIPCPDVSSAELPGVRALVRRPADELGARGAIEPTLNVSSLASGYQGAGSLTIVPSSARAKVDIRTVAGQHTDGVVAAVRDHLREQGFDDIEVRLLHAIDGTASPMTGPFAEAAIATAASMFGEPVIHPQVAGAGPLAIVASRLGMPIVAPPGSTRMSSTIHGPDENIAVADYLDQVAFLVELFLEYGRRESGGSR